VETLGGPLNCIFATADLLSFQYQAITDRKQYYRLLSSHLLHGNLLHIALVCLLTPSLLAPATIFTDSVAKLCHSIQNISTTWSLSVEKLVGTVLFVELTLLLMCLCGLAHLFLINILQRFALPSRIASELSASSIGYSGVVFGLSAIAIFASPGAIHSIPILGITIPRLLVPVFSLVVTHFLIPNASLLGHVSGTAAQMVANQSILELTYFWSV
jgi:membrane associated rhomboid family serine protease